MSPPVEACGDQRELPGLERRTRDRRRRRVLRNDGRLVQGARRENRQVAVAVQDGLRRHRAARDLSCAGRQTVCRRAVRCAAAGQAVSLRPISTCTRRERAGNGWANALPDLTCSIGKRRHAPCLRASLRSRCCSSLTILGERRCSRREGAAFHRQRPRPSAMLANVSLINTTRTGFPGQAAVRVVQLQRLSCAGRGAIWPTAHG